MLNIIIIMMLLDQKQIKKVQVWRSILSNRMISDAISIKKRKKGCYQLIIVGVHEASAAIGRHRLCNSEYSCRDNCQMI